MYWPAWYPQRHDHFWTGFAKGNVAAAVKMTVIGLTTGSLAIPLYVRAMLGASIEMDISSVFSQIVLIVFLPMALGYATPTLPGQKIWSENFC